MQECFARLGRTGDVHAAMVGLTLDAHHVPATFRAALRHVEFLVPARMLLVLDYLDDFGNHVAAALYRYPVADLHAQPLNLVGIVQRGAGDSGASDAHRL